MRWISSSVAVTLMLSLTSIEPAMADWQIGLRSGWRWERGGIAVGEETAERRAARLAPQLTRQWKNDDSVVNWRLSPAVELPDRGSVFSRIASDLEWVPKGRETSRMESADADPPAAIRSCDPLGRSHTMASGDPP